LIDDYVDACVKDIHRQRAEGLRDATSVFFGGGTPSLLSGDQLARILDAIPRTSSAEITVECNPDAQDAERLNAYAQAGVNRLSFGVQSMDSRVLAALGRTHNPENVLLAVNNARAAGIKRLNLDLIYGTPGESLEDWQRSVEGVIALAPDHISAYALTVEPATPFGQRVASGEAGPDDDYQADAYLLAENILSNAGYNWYEISNWSLPGEECRHNLVYWLGGDFATIGCAAHGHIDGQRWWNVRTPEKYIERVEAGRDGISGSESLEPSQRLEEAFSLRLRTRAGVTPARAAESVVNELVSGGLAKWIASAAGVESLGIAGSERSLVLTPAGRLVATDVTARLLLAGAAVS
jgi:oxygen-independent coproporphyrinogen-3 oxidase